MPCRIGAGKTRAPDHDIHMMTAHIGPQPLPQQFERAFGAIRRQHARTSELSRAKTASSRYPFVEDVLLMDAHRMTFDDATFDCVVAQFVITLVADPERVLSECHRVVKPGGRIILVNHYYSEVGVAAAVERWTARHTRRLGLRPEFPFGRLQASAQARPDAALIGRRKLAPFGIYTLVCFERTGSLGVVRRHPAVTQIS